jgi:hypothetical protein
MSRRSNIKPKFKQTKRIEKIMDKYEISLDDSLALSRDLEWLNNELVDAQEMIMEAKFALGESRYQ